MVRSSLVTGACIALSVVCQHVSAQAAATAVDHAPLISVLIIDGQNNHAWRDTTPVLRAILDRSGRFSTAVATAPENADEIAAFAPAFGDFDLVVSNYNGQLWSAATRAMFDDFVRGGGGFVCVHAANNAFPRWAEYNAMIGLGGWGGRNERAGPYVRWRDGAVVRDTQPGRGGSHGRRHAFALDARDPQHPILAGLPQRWMHATDELYDRLRGPAEQLTVLATAYSGPKTGGSGAHEPLLMTIEHGAGRVFHTALGHDVIAMRCVGFQTTLLRGAEWAATGAVTLPVPADFPGAKAVVSRDPQVDGFQPLFDGATLSGWQVRYGNADYTVDGDAIVGTTVDGSPNSFLCTELEFADFELAFEVQVEDALNSGVQIRSQCKPEHQNGHVFGPQVEIEAAPGEAGHIYAEATGRGWLSPEAHRNDPARRVAFCNGRWNRYLVRAEGPRIRTWVNGVPVGDVTDPESAPRGVIGLQVHSVPRGQGPYSVRWRDLRLRPLMAPR